MTDVLNSILKRIRKGESSAYLELSQQYFLDEELRSLIERVLAYKSELNHVDEKAHSKDQNARQEDEKALGRVDEKRLVDSLTGGIRGRDSGARERFYADYRRIMGTSKYLLTDELEDLAHDVFLKVCKAIESGKTFNSFTEFEGFVRITKNSLAIDGFRKKYIKKGETFVRRQLQLDAGPDAAEIPLTTSEPSPEEAASAREVKDFIAHAMEQLPQDLKEVAVLRWKELKNKDIAASLGIPESTATVRWKKAEKILRRILKPLKPY
jgi:RNA polymerase sigma factor (sigma-70 family)